ncbi:Ig-like domain repeat protein [Algibacter sp. AS12]|uniref:Ig-like domain repeat protein n=1 Tax=Algibacter sp. AS12 TaxID=3135773 RepID=UPI00398BB532
MKNNSIKLITFLLLMVLFASCSNNSEEEMDTTAPTVLIQSPDVNQSYVGYWGGAWPETDRVNLKALGTDETEIASIKLIVINSSGALVFEKTVNSATSNQTELIISESFTPPEVDTYSVVFVVNDVNGNIETSESRTFVVE